MRVDIPGTLDLEQIETAIAQLEGESSLELIIASFGGADLLGEARLLQLMTLARQLGVPVEMRLTHELPPIEDAPRSPMWKAARDDLSALIMLETANAVLDIEGVERRDELLGAARGNVLVSGGEIGFGRERSLVAIDRPGAPRPFHAFIESSQQFQEVKTRLGELATVLGFDEIGKDKLETVTTFAGEAIENTRDHAREDLAGNRTEGIRFVQLRRHMVSRQRGMTQLPVSEGRLRDYLHRLAAGDELGDEKLAQFAELTIADSGVGIPARLLDSENVYQGPIAAEVELALRAMRPHESSKPGSISGRGQGLKNALDAAAVLRGIIVLRTGRLTLTRDTTDPAPRGQEGWHIDESPYVPGTTLSLLLPWWVAGQARMTHKVQ